MNWAGAPVREMDWLLRLQSQKPLSIVGYVICSDRTGQSDDQQALIWFATHFKELATILAERNGVICLHLAVEVVPTHSSLTKSDTA
jgi:hypothetical protein